VDWLTFIVKVIDALAWPVIVLIAAFLFRRPVIELIPALQRLRIKNIEMEFNRDLNKLEQHVLFPIPVREQLPKPEKDTLERLQRIAATAPIAALFGAWREVEAAAADAGSRHGITATGGLWELFEGLRNQKVLDSTQVETLEALRKLRNKVAHAREGEVTEDQALRYVEIAMILAETLRRSVKDTN